MLGLRRISPATFVLLALGLLYAGVGLTVSLCLFPIGDLDVESDFFAELGPAAQRITAGDVAPSNHPYKGPVQPALVALLHAVLEPLGVGWYRSAVVLSLLATLFTLAASHRLALAVADRRVALGAVLLTAGSSLTFVQGHKASSDMVFLALATWTVAVAMSGEPVRARRWLLVGVLAGAAFLTRYVGVVLFGWAAAVGWWRAAGRPWRERVPAGGLVVAGFLLVVGPWFVINLLETGALLTTRNAENIAREFDSLTAGPEIVAHYLLNLGTRLGQFARLALGWPMAIAAAIGLVVVLASRPSRRLKAVLAWSAVYLAALALVFFRPRFGLPLVPVAALVTAILFLGEPAGSVGRLIAWRGQILGWIVVALLILTGVPRTISAVRFFADQQPRHLDGTVTFLIGAADNWPADSPPALMARKAHAAFHGGLDWRPYPVVRMSAREFLLLAAEREVDLILAGPVERDYGDVAFALEHLERFEGVEVAYADSANTVFSLDRGIAPAQLGRDPAAAAQQQRLTRAFDHGDPTGALQAGRDLARRYRENGELARSQEVLQAVLDSADLPAADLDVLAARADLAWTCVLTEDHAAGAAALAVVLPDLAAQSDRLLEARAHEYLAIHLAASGRTDEARRLLQSAASLYDGEQRPDQGRRTRMLIGSLPPDRRGIGGR